MSTTSTTENGTLRQMAQDSLKGKWGLAIGTLFLNGLIVAIGSNIPFVGFLISIVITGPMTLGVAIFALNISRNTNPKLENIFDGFKNFGQAFIANFLVGLFVILWMLLLIVPGIIKAYSYSMVNYILADEPNIEPMAALRKSQAMMDGNKLKLFYMHCFFFLLALACILTLGIGFLWLTPYTHVVTAKFYEDIKGANLTEADAPKVI